MAIQAILDTYYQGWARQDEAQVRSVVANEMTHRSPEDQFEGAEAFLSQCWIFSEGLTGVGYKRSILTDNAAFVILEWQTQTGSFMNAEYVRVVGDKIVEVIVISNSQDLKKMITDEKIKN